MAAGLQSFPGTYPLGFTPRRSVVDSVTGRPVISSAPTGAVQQRASLLPVGRDDSGGLVPAVPQGVFDAIDAARFPGQVLRGEKGVFDPATGHTSDEALGAATGLAGLAMTGSMPFGAPKGALRSFGGAAAKDDPLAALEAGLALATKDMAPEAPPRTFVDPNAKSWDLYHGTNAPADFARFDVNLDQKARLHSPEGERGAVFLTPAPGEAAHYAGDLIGKDAVEGAGPRIIRTTVDPGKTGLLDLPALMENDPTFVAKARENFLRDGKNWDAVAAEGPEAVERARSSLSSMFDERHTRMLDEFRSARDLNTQLTEMGYPATEIPQVQWGYGATAAAIQRAREQGLDTAVLRGLSESNGGDQIVALTPGRVRSFYSPDQVLYSGGRGAAPAGAAALAVPDAAPTPQQEQPMTAGLGNLSPEDFAAIFGAAPPGGAPAARRIPFGLGVPQSAGADGAERPDAAMPSFGLGSQMPDAPQMPPTLAPAAPQRQEPPAPRMMAEAPLPPPRPAEFGTPSADMPAPNAVPTSGNLPTLPGSPASAPLSLAGPAKAPASDDGFDFGGALKRFTDRGGGDLLVGLGTGLMSTPGFGPGVAAGFQNAQRAEQQRAVTGLAQAELGLKQRKLAQETGALQGNAAIVKRAFPNLSDAEAAAAGSNSGQVSEALKILRDPTHGINTSRVTVGGNIYELKPGERPSAATLIGPAKDPNEAEKYTLTDLQDGSKVAVSRTDPTDVKVIAPGQAPRAITAEERTAFGIPAGTPVKMTAKDGPVAIGSAQTNVNVGTPEKEQDKIVGKGYGELQLDMATKGRNAGSTLNTLSLMEQAMKMPGFYSGFGGESAKRANQILGALGVKDSKAASPAEVFDALSNKVVLDGLGGSLGPGISNTDRDYIARTAPTLAQSEQGNRDLIGVARSLAQRQQVVSKLARDYAAKNGGRLDAGFDQALDEFAAQNPLFPQAQAGQSASAPKEPPQGAPRGARQAPDGAWYAPDPNRPGKYLKVQ